MSMFASVLAAICTVALLIIALACVSVIIYVRRASLSVIRAAHVAATSIADVHAFVSRAAPVVGEQIRTRWHARA